jgi:uncharacterized membrane protein YqaE (UPF0057 family)
MRVGLAIVLAFIVPPASVAISRGFGVAFAVSLLLTASGPLVFRYLFAGPGLGLCLLAVIHALVALRSRQDKIAAAA